MTIKMTREEYKRLYGVEPTSKITTAPKSSSTYTEEAKKPTANKISDFLGGKGVTDFVGAKIAKARLPQDQRQFVEEPTKKQVAGSAIQLGALAIPGAGVGANLATKMAVGAGTGLALDVGQKMQTGEPIRPGVGTAVGTALPIGGTGIRVASRVMGRLFKGLGSGLSGVSSKTIDSILENPRIAQEASRRISKSGADKVLEENARMIVNGVSKIRQEARKAFGEGLEQLAETDIDGAVFRQNTQKFLDRYGVSQKDGARLLENVEFDDPKNLKKASELIDRLSGTDLDGKTLRKLADDIESAKYKTAVSDERLAFNAFLGDLSSSLKNAVSASTDKLGEINKAFSQDVQLAEAVEQIFGKVKFKNLKEVVNASKRLESLFSQKGLQPQVMDDFLNRIGIKPETMKTTEAVRQISSKELPNNTQGLSISEAVRGVTSAIVTPEMVGKAAQIVGMTQQEFMPILRKMTPQGKVLFINALLSGKESQTPSPNQATPGI